MSKVCETVFDQLIIKAMKFEHWKRVVTVIEGDGASTLRL